VNGYYVLTTSDAYLGHDIYVATAPTPVGPFTNRTDVYTAPEGGGDIYAPYNVAAHSELSRPGERDLLQRQQSEDEDLYANINNNRARFLDLACPGRRAVLGDRSGSSRGRAPTWTTGEHRSSKRCSPAADDRRRRHATSEERQDFRSWTPRCTR
jgi:hypothetical protein